MDHLEESGVAEKCEMCDNSVVYACVVHRGALRRGVPSSRESVVKSIT